MKIDITPVKISAPTPAAKLRMEIYERPLFAVQRANGEICTVDFDPKSLDEFLPNRNVSQVLQDWEDNHQRRILHLKDCLEKGIHPHWERDVETEDGNILKDQDVPLTASQKLFWETELATLRAQSGKLTFVAYVN